jgi:hypothetical protein
MKGPQRWRNVLLMQWGYSARTIGKVVLIEGCAALLIKEALAIKKRMAEHDKAWLGDVVFVLETDYLSLEQHRQDQNRNENGRG